MGRYQSPMSVDEFIEYAEKYFRDALEELRDKNRDYSRGGRALGDVFDIANETNMRPSFVAFIHASKHWTAIRNFVGGTHLRSEDIANRLLDTANYMVILSAIIHYELRMQSMTSIQIDEAPFNTDEDPENIYSGSNHKFEQMGEHAPNICKRCGLAQVAKIHRTSREIADQRS